MRKPYSIMLLDRTKFEGWVFIGETFETLEEAELIASELASNNIDFQYRVIKNYQIYFKGQKCEI